jgi:uncharacterized membrane protein YkvI
MPDRFRGLAKRILLPGIILQSVLVGGGFATGREIVEYGGKFGPMGWISGVSIFLGFSLMSILSFEAARKWKVFDYKSLVKKLIGKSWIGFEIIYLALAILTIAVMAAAAGEILRDIFSLNYWVGVSAIVFLVALFNFKGEDFIAKMKSIGTLALFIAYTIFGLSVFFSRTEQVFDAFSFPVGINGEPLSGLGPVVWTGILYVGYNLGVYPASLFTLRKLKSRKESIYAGIFSGLLMTVPWFLTYMAIMAYYPDMNVLGATIPWLKMLQPFNNFYILAFGVVVGWTLVETATGVIHAFIGRVDQDLIDHRKSSLTSRAKGIISITALILALILAQVGIIDLIAKGYRFMAYGMILFYAIPLLFSSFRIMSDKPA